MGIFPGWTIRKLIGTASLALSSFIAVLGGRVYLDGKRNYEKAEQMVSAGDRESALVFFEEAARAYFPGSPYTLRALKRMELMAKGARMRGEVEESARIWEVIRRSIISTRHVTQPNTDILNQANGAIAELTAGATDLDTPRGALEKRTSSPDDPSFLTSLLLVFGFLLWIGGSIGVISHKEASSRMKKAHMACALSGLGLWVVMSLTA